MTACACTCIHFINTLGEEERCFNAYKMGLWKSPSFTAEMTENLEWKEDLRA